MLIQQGTLYPALFRLEYQGVISSEWGESENIRKAKYYELTRADRERLAGETEKWNRLSGMIGIIPRATPEGASAPSHLSLAYCRNYVLRSFSLLVWGP